MSSGGLPQADVYGIIHTSLLLVKDNPLVADGTARDGRHALTDNVSWLCIFKVRVAGGSESDGHDVIIVGSGRRITSVDVESALKDKKIHKILILFHN